MSTVIKAISQQPIRLIIDDFWNPDGAVDKPLASSEIQPEVKLRESKTNYILEFIAPGFKKENFKVTTENGYLPVEAAKNCDGVKHGTCTCQHSAAVPFTQTYCLPDNIIEDNIRASYQDGILSINLKKIATSFSVKKLIKID